LDRYENCEHVFVVPMVMWADEGARKVRTAIWLFDNPACPIRLWEEKQGHSNALQIQALTLAKETDLPRTLTGVMKAIKKVSETRFDRHGFKIRIALTVLSADNKCGWVMSGVLFFLRFVVADVDTFIVGQVLGGTFKSHNSNADILKNAKNSLYCETFLDFTVLGEVIRMMSKQKEYWAMVAATPNFNFKSDTHYKRITRWLHFKYGAGITGPIVERAG